MAEREVIRDFTKARKFPNLIGRTPDGRRLLGGPYTITQFVGGGVVALGLYILAGIWMVFDPITNTVMYFGLVGGTVFVLGKMRLGGRSPVSVLQGVVSAVSAPRRPPVNGRTVKSGPVFVHPGGYLHPAPRAPEFVPEPVLVQPLKMTVVGPNKSAVPARYASALGRGDRLAGSGPGLVQTFIPSQVAASLQDAGPPAARGSAGVQGLMAKAKNGNTKERPVR